MRKSRAHASWPVTATAPLSEIGDCALGTAHSLDPDVLDARQFWCFVDRGDEHLRRERLVDSVPLPIEIGPHHDRVVIGDCGLQRLTRRSGALEARGGKELDGIPANPFAGLAAPQRSLVDVLQAAEGSTGLEEAAFGVVSTPAGQEGGTRGKAADSCGV